MSNPEPPTLLVRTTANGSTFLVELAGEMDMTTSPALSQAIERTPEGTALVVVDLAELGFLDSSGLNALVRGRRVLADREISMCVVVPPESPIRRVFEITRLTESLSVVDTQPPSLRL